MFYQVLVSALILSTTWAQLPPKVIKIKESLSKELQSIPEVVPNTNHAAQHDTQHERVHQLLDEFIEQNQRSLDAVLRVLQLIDHDLENVIQDCVRIFDIESLQSNNPIFVKVVKPLLDRVQDLCTIVTENRIDELEASLEKVERTATWYREMLDQTLQNIAIISSNLEDSSHYSRTQLKEAEILENLQNLNSSLLEPMEQNFTNYFTKWIAGYKNFSLALPEEFGFNSDEQPEISNLFDFLDFLDNETTILQDELQEFLEFWFSMIEETILAINNETLIVLEELKTNLLQDLLDDKSELTCAAAYLQNTVPLVQKMFNEFHRCVRYEDEMTKAFRQVSSVLDSTDKAINFLLDSYVTCARMTTEFAEITLGDCLIGVEDLLDQTQEFVEHKATEVYYHVEDALVFNGVMIEACLGLKVRETVLVLGGFIRHYHGCNGGQGGSNVVLGGF